MPRCIPSRRKCCRVIALSFLFTLTTTILLLYYILFHHALPMRRSYCLETDYLRTLRSAELQDRIDARLPKHSGGRDPQRRVRQLIEDVPQLHYWSNDKLWDALLGLHYDGTGVSRRWGDGMGSDEEYWIYLGGTPSTSAAESDEKSSDPTVFSHPYKTHSCKDPPSICAAYNSAFNAISTRWHGAKIHPSDFPSPPATSKAILRFADCDISPLLCDSPTWGLNQDAILLIHLSIGTECEYSAGIDRCPTTWRLIGLPILKAPWTRKIRIPLDDGSGSTVVEAFPDADEQLYSLMAFAGAEEALEYGSCFDASWNCIITITPGVKATTSYTAPLGIANWGGFRSFVDNPFEMEEWPKEIVVKCYVERYVDMFLQWWDGDGEREEGVVWPRSCEGVEEEMERKRRMRRTWESIVEEDERRRRERWEAEDTEGDAEFGFTKW